MKTNTTTKPRSAWGFALFHLFLAGMLSPAALAASSNPQPASGDLVLPMPSGESMVFRPVAIGKGDSPYAVREFRMGDRTAGTYQEYPTPVVVGGAFRNAGDWVFYIGKYEVTEAQYAALAGGGGGSPMPVTGVSWFDAVEFSNKYNQWLFANATSKLPKNGDRVGHVRLPTEIEWEFVARGGGAVSEDAFDLQHPYGDALRQHEWYSGAESSHNKKKAIGLLKPNPLGVHDLLGNVSEMTSSPYMVEYYQGRVGGFVSRGADYYTSKQQLRASYRAEQPYYSRGDQPKPASAPTLGFRLVLSAPLHVGGTSKGELEREWDSYRESRIVPTIPKPQLATQFGKTSASIEQIMADLELLRKTMRSGQQVTPKMISRVGLLASNVANVQSLANSGEKKQVAALVRIIGNSGFFFGRENYKVGVGEKLLKLLEDAPKRDYEREFARQQKRKQNTADSWKQYRDVLKQLGERDARIADEAFEAFRKEVERVGNKTQKEVLGVIRGHLIRYRETQRITFADYAKDFEEVEYSIGN